MRFLEKSGAALKNNEDSILLVKQLTLDAVS